MAEYIERESLIKDFQYCGASSEIIDAIVYRINLHEAADVAPVRHARWIEQEKYTFGVMYDCSICDNLILDNGHSWNYCPNCGAKMDGGDGNIAMT